jgi:hypothetical protein
MRPPTDNWGLNTYQLRDKPETMVFIWIDPRLMGGELSERDQPWVIDGQQKVCCSPFPVWHIKNKLDYLLLKLSIKWKTNNATLSEQF